MLCFHQEIIDIDSSVQQTKCYRKKYPVYVISESAKLRALWAHVPTRLACSRAHVPTCLMCLSAHVPTSLACSRAHMPTCLACSRALVPKYLACLRAHKTNVRCVLCVPTCSRAITEMTKITFSITCFPYILRLFFVFFL